MFYETILASDIRYAYAQSPALAKVFEHRATIDAAMASLAVPVAAARRASLSDDEARRALTGYVHFLRSFEAGGWHGLSAGEIAAAAIVRSPTLPAELHQLAFHPMLDEEQLSAPVARYLRGRNFDVFAEVATSRKRADLVGTRWGPLGGTVVAVELKNALADFERGMDQVSTYAAYAHEVWIACTPALAASYLDAHSRGVAVLGWDPNWLEKKLAAIGCGLLLVEGTQVTKVRSPRLNGVDSRSRAEVQRVLAGRRPWDPDGPTAP
jgi:hypothetical protein